MSKLNKIAHLSSAHTRYDTRIFLKMCSSLATIKSHEVYLVIADGKSNEVKNGVSIIDVGVKIGGRISRMTKTVSKIFEIAKELDCDVYHLHDPELLTIGIKLKKLGKIVIFDSHEDVGKDILSKDWIPLLLRKTIAMMYNKYESYVCKQLDYIVTATPFIRDKFLKINQKSQNINNFPILGELSNDTNWEDKKDEVCYVGGIAKIRGIREIVKAMAFTPLAKLNLAGTFSEKEIETEVKSYESWSKVNELGFLGREEVAEVMSQSKAGLVTLHPIINYLDALPVKMFEYMASGLPVISSNIELWKEIVEGNSCGICVDPLNPQEIADAINYILTHPKEAQQMGQNGQETVLAKYNWGVEEKKLFEVYGGLI